MPSKRYTRSKYSVAQRLDYLSRQVRNNRPEMKTISFDETDGVLTSTIVATELNQIAAGDRVFDRVGNKVKVHRIEVMGKTGNIHAQIFLLKGTGNDEIPLYTYFSPTMGGGFNDNWRSQYNTLYHHIPTSHNNSNFRINLKFKTPIEVSFKGTASTDSVKNTLWCVLKNNTGTSVVPSYTGRIWYTDA